MSAPTTPAADHAVAAPPGFTAEQWEQFDRDGFLALPDVLEDRATDALLDAVHEVAHADPKYRAERFYGPDAAVERHPALAELIAHPRHIGYAYDLYGEQLRLNLSQLFIRPRGGAVTEWHIDGARMVPYRQFAPRWPLQLKIGYWLTDVTDPAMGNLVVIPGSHRDPVLPAYNTHDDVPGQVHVCLRRGSLTLMHNDLWHRVAPNQSDVARCSMYLAYSPSWLQAADRLTTDPAWAATLPRSARIIMRPYERPYDFAKPPAADVPLFLPRADDPPRDDASCDHVPDHLAARRLPIERFLGGS